MLCLAAIFFTSVLLRAQSQSGVFQVLHSFAAPGSTNSDGSFPIGLIISGNTLYGTAEQSGSAGSDAVFALNTNGAGFTTLYDFSPLQAGYPAVNADGAYPKGLLLSGNVLYGTAAAGGLAGYGTVFSVNADGTGFATLYAFTNGIDGASPTPGLILSGNALYGTAESGGSGNGTVFALYTNGTGFTNIHTFTGGNDGGLPQAGLILSGNTLYGTAETGGNADSGTVFALNTDGTGFATLYSFSDFIFTNSDGASPESGLILSGNTLYGTTTEGGTGGAGTVFSLNTDSTGFTNLHNFTAIFDATNNDGSTPLSGLTLWSNTLYGTTSDGGSAGAGTVFALNTNGSNFAVLHTFTGGSDGANPNGGLIYAGSTLYGTAAEDGSGSGTVFSISLGPVSAPSVTGNPVSQTVEVGGSATLQVTASGTGALTYQWLFDGAKISAATNNALLLTGLTTSKAGSYEVIVKNPYGSATSAVAFVSVLVPPSIATQPVNQTDSVGGAASFTVKAAGSPLTYQWYFGPTPLSDGGNISGSATNKLIVAPVTTNNAGSYSVVVFNGSTSVTSKVALLTLSVEKTKPSVTIKFPAANSRTNAPVLSGTASDSVRVLSVEYWVTNVNQGVVSSPLNGQAVLTPGTGSASNWTIPSASLALLPGTNILAVQSFNYAGLSSPFEKVAFFYQSTALFTLTTNGPGSVTGVASIKGNPAPPAQTELYVGESYTLTAKSANNYWLTNWTTNGMVAGTNATLSFLMESNLTVTANFTSNLFVGEAARYDGIFYLSDSQGVTEESSGLIENLLVKTNGVYSGKMYLAGTTIALSGTFNRSGQVTESLGSIAAAGGKVTLQLELTNGYGQITGLLQGTGWTASNLYLYAATTNTNNYPAYTVLLVQDPNAPGNPPDFGYALITNNGSMISMGGVLADGTPFSRSEPINVQDRFPIYANLYGNKGLLLGNWSLAAGIFGEVPAGNLGWIKPAQTTGLYKSGYNTAIGVQGSPWTNGASVLAGLFPNNTQLTLSNGGFASNIVCTVQLTTSNTFKLISGSNFSSGSINPANGLLTVTFTNASGKKITANGTILQNLSIGGGFFIGATNVGTIALWAQTTLSPLGGPQATGLESLDSGAVNQETGGQAPPVILPFSGGAPSSNGSPSPQ